MDGLVENSSFVDDEDEVANALDDIDNSSGTTDAEDEEEITSNDSGNEEKSEKDDVDGREKTDHEVAEDEKKDVYGSETTDHEEAEDGKKDGDGRENTSDSANQDGQTKKSKKGLGKKLKMCMGTALQSVVPKFPKTTYKIGGYFEASNEVSDRNDGKGKAGKITSTTPNDEDQKISSAYAAKLRKANKRLRKQVEKLQDELRESQSSRANLIAKMSTQSEEQRVEVNRLDVELKKVAKDKAKLEQDKQSIEDKYRRNVESLQIMKQELETMTSLKDELYLELSKPEEIHRLETSCLIVKLETVEKEKNELTVQHREQLMEAEMENLRQKREIKELEYEVARLKAITGFLGI